MRIFLSGPMGAGKSTVAREVAHQLGATAIDLDERIARREGTTIPDIFRARGEAAFRAVEHNEALRVAEGEGDVVVALGGGTVADKRTRRRLLERGILVTLMAPPDALLARVGTDEGRPLLAEDDPRAVLERVLRERANAYAECHAYVQTEGRDTMEIASEVASVARERPVVVPLGERSYRVEIGAGMRTRVGRRTANAARGEVVVLVTDRGASPWADAVGAEVEAAGKRVARVTLEPGETHKSVDSVTRVWDAALDAGLDRDGMVLGVGGGMVGDLAGFAASTLLRGVALGHVPTTLLAMVDSAIGGKTGFNRPQGKNLVGTFHQPRFVLCDVDTLGTLADRERVAGLAEVVKSAWIDGETSVAMLEHDVDALAVGDAEAMRRAVRMAAALKARVVTADEREAGQRMLLNLGHTVGHALEAARGYTGLLHGEAVSIGMVAAFRVAVALGYATEADAARMSHLLTRLGLPTGLDAYVDAGTLRFVDADKKRRGGQVRFVMPGAPGATSIVPLPPETLTSHVLR